MSEQEQRANEMLRAGLRCYVRLRTTRARHTVVHWKAGKVTLKPVVCAPFFSCPEEQVELEPTLEKRT